ncbi:MAG: DUF302 domain-containing protein [Anaerolineales bacterium]
MKPPTTFAHQVEFDLDFDRAVERVTAALKTEGFGVLTEIDVKKTIREKLDLEFQRYVILGACNPPLAHQALSTDLSIGLLLPCNAIVYETEGGGSIAAFLDPQAMFSLVDSPDLADVAADATARIQRVVASLRG